MNRAMMYVGTSAVLAFACTANAGIQFSSTVGDTSNLLSDFATLQNGGSSSGLALNTASGFTGSNQINFGSLPGANPAPNGNFNINVSATDAPNSFYLGLTQGLDNTYFNAGDTPRPADGSVALAFGNLIYTSNEIRLDFTPDTVTAFGFNYEDVGDVGSTLTVAYTNGTSETLNLAAYDADGYVSIVSDIAGVEIGSVTLTQVNPSNDDGFAFYDFSTVQVVPLPTAAFAGLGLLGGLGVVRRLRRN